MAEETLTLKDLQKATNVPAYTIQYLKSCGRLSIIQESQGRGYPTLFHPDAVKVILKHIKLKKARREVMNPRCLARLTCTNWRMCGICGCLQIRKEFPLCINPTLSSRPSCVIRGRFSYFGCRGK